MAGIEVVNPSSIKSQTSPKAQTTAKNFNAFLGAADAFGPTGATTASLYGTPTSATVLSAAFSGVSSLNAQTGGVPSYAGGAYGGGGGLAQHASYGFAGKQAIGDPSRPVVPGTDGFSHADLINQMNQNNLYLLELQATMQSNMQAWNTKSNILSADHRARMAMIEKFTARG